MVGRIIDLQVPSNTTTVPEKEEKLDRETKSEVHLIQFDANIVRFRCHSLCSPTETTYYPVYQK